MRVLFLLKKNETYGFNHYSRRSSGLWNSTRFIVECLRYAGFEVGIEELIDNNCIDRAVAGFKPDLVIVEALWVVPEKFPILMKLHPAVKWCVHLHSHMPFLALEGIAMDWITRYAELNVGIIANSETSYAALRCILEGDEVVFLPNVYIGNPRKPEFTEKEKIDIACYGAVRPLKNQLIQALAAIEFAKEKGKPLRFHINASRTETGGDPVLKNIRQLFEQEPNAELIENKWHEPADFLKVLEPMDIGMQVSLSETFNVVTADYVTAGIPIVTSKEVKWACSLSKADDDSVKDILSVMRRAWKNKMIVKWNQKRLAAHSKRAQRLWIEFIGSFCD